MHENETKFFIDNLYENQIVLEWGSGESTIKIGKIVKKIYSIEHIKRWYDEIKSRMPSNAEIFLVSVNMKDLKADGDLTEFKEYVEKPLEFNEKFDLILIDGRARYECGKIAYKLADENTKIFVHDFAIPPIPTRESYIGLLEYFDIIEHVKTLVLLKKK